MTTPIFQTELLMSLAETAPSAEQKVEDVSETSSTDLEHT